jgi:hypothetical protein
MIFGKDNVSSRIYRTTRHAFTSVLHAATVTSERSDTSDLEGQRAQSGSCASERGWLAGSAAKPETELFDLSTVISD